MFSERLVQLFDEYGFTGYTKHLLTPNPETESLSPPNYYGLDITGGVQIDWSIALAGREFKRCNGCGGDEISEPVWSAYGKLVNRCLRNSWTGHDFVLCPRTQRPAVTRRVVDVIVKSKASNFLIGKEMPCFGVQLRADRVGEHWYEQALLKEREHVFAVSGLDTDTWERESGSGDKNEIDSTSK